MVYPEKQLAAWTAVRYSADHVFDYISLTDDYSIYETAVPSDWVGKSIIELQVRQKNQLNILATKYDDVLDPMPGADHIFREDELVYVLGSNKTLAKFLRL